MPPPSQSTCTCTGSFLGARRDAVANETVLLDADVTSPGSAVRVLVVEAREDLEVMRQVRECLGASSVIQRPTALRAAAEGAPPTLRANAACSSSSVQYWLPSRMRVLKNGA